MKIKLQVYHLKFRNELLFKGHFLLNIYIF